MKNLNHIKWLKNNTQKQSIDKMDNLNYKLKLKIKDLKNSKDNVSDDNIYDMTPMDIWYYIIDITKHHNVLKYLNYFIKDIEIKYSGCEQYMELNVKAILHLKD